MAKNLFKKAGTARSFKGGPNQQAFVSNIEKQTRTIVDAQKLAKAQAKEQDDIEITGMSRKFDFEEGVLKTKHKLEDAVRKHKLDAVAKHADTDVRRLEGEAAELKKEADYLADIAPKRAKVAGDLAKGITTVATKLYERQQFDKWNESSNSDVVIDKHTTANFDILSNQSLDKKKLTSQREINQASRRGKQSSFLNSGVLHHADWTENRKFHLDQVDEIVNLYEEKTGKELKITEHTAVEIYREAGYQELARRGVNPTSKYGKKIMQEYLKAGKLRASSIANSNDTRATKSNNNFSTDVVHALHLSKTGTHKGDDGKIYSDINLEWNDGIHEATHGKYKDNQDYYSPNGYGEGYSEYLSHFLERHGHKFKSREQLETFLGQFKVIGDKKGMVGTENWTVKHAVRTEEAIEEWELGAEKRKKDAQKKRDAFGDNAVIRYGTDIDALKEKNDGTLSTEDQHSIIAKASKDENMNPSQKSEVYSMVGWDKTGYKSASIYLMAHKAAKEGNEGDLQKALANMDPEGRKKFAQEVKLLQTITEGVRPIQSGKTIYSGMDAVSKINTKKIKKLSQGRTAFGPAGLNESGLAVVTIADQIIMNEIDGMKDDKNLTPSQMYQKANATLEDKYINTAARLVPDKENPGQYILPDNAPKGAFIDNPFNYVSGEGGVPGLYTPGVTFVNSTDPDTNIANSLADILNDKGKKTSEVEDTNVNQEGVQVVELDDNTIITRDGDETLNHVRLVSPDKGEVFIKQLAADSQDDVSSFDDITEIMPKKLKLWADVNGVSYSVATNKWLRKKGVNLRVSLDGTDAVMFKGTQYQKPKPYNIYASDLLYTTQAQGAFPMEYQVDYSVNEGLTPTEAWGKKFDVQWSVDETSKINMDSTLFFENGGAALMDRSMAQSLGLLKWDPTVGWIQNEGERQAEIKLFKERLRRLKK